MLLAHAKHRPVSDLCSLSPTCPRGSAPHLIQASSEMSPPQTGLPWPHRITRSPLTLLWFFFMGFMMDVIICSLVYLFVCF